MAWSVFAVLLVLLVWSCLVVGWGWVGVERGGWGCGVGVGTLLGPEGSDVVCFLVCLFRLVLPVGGVGGWWVGCL